jgi:hypothetical protein
MTRIKVPDGVVHHEPIPTIRINHSSISSHKLEMMNLRTICELLSRWTIYAMVVVFLGLNAFALLYRSDTIYYLRIYQLVSYRFWVKNLFFQIVACIMLISSGVMIEFMVYANRHLSKLSSPHSIPRPMMVSSLMLTLGIILGYAYFIIFNLTFRHCDTLVDTVNPKEVCKNKGKIVS